MPDGFTEARPFSNGSDADFFEEHFCMRCAKCKVDELTQAPRDRCCPTYRAFVKAWIDPDFWPKEGCIKEDEKGRAVCVDFFSADPWIMKAYEQAIPQTYLGYTLHNMDGYFTATDESGKVVLRCGTKRRLEDQLLVISNDKTKAKEV